MTEHDFIATDDEKVKLPEQDYLIAIITGMLFMSGGILQLVLGTVDPKTLTGDITIGLFFLLPGTLGFIYGIVNLTKSIVQKRKERKQVLKEKYDIE